MSSHFRRLCGCFFLLMVLLLLCRTPAILAAQLSPDRQFQFATRCFEDGDYSVAVSEFKRFIFFFPDDPRVETAHYRIGMSYFYTRGYSSAIEQFSKLLDQTGPTETGIHSAFMISACYRGLHDYPSAIDSLHHLAGLTEDRNTLDKIYYNLGLLYIDSGDFQNARLFFVKISKNNYAKYRVKTVCNQLDQKERIPRKSPVVAGLASIIPGGGYLYCKRYRDAFFAFMINAALGYAAYESFDEDLYALGGIIAVAEAGFYAGSIYGGISSAHKYNDARKNEFINDFKKRFGLEMSAGLKPDGILFSLNYRF